MRCYAQGGGETRKAYHLLRQAELVSDPQKRMAVVKRMYRYRFGQEELPPDMNLFQLRGKEGARVRTAYAEASRTYGVPWHGRRYDRNNWGSGDPVNRALSAANALLNGLCHTAIVSGGYSPALGFIHTGKQLSFVYDIADLYKVEVTIPLAFRLAAESKERIGPRVREACREAFREHRLLKRILPDIDHLLDVPEETLAQGQEADIDPARPEPLWSPPNPAVQTETVTAAHTEHNEDSEARRRRHRRAEEGLRSGWTVRRRAPGEWHVVTRPESPGYTIQRVQGDGPDVQPSGCHVEGTRPDVQPPACHVEGAWRCNCPDFENNGLGFCKHTLAVELVQAAQEAEGGA